MSHIRPRSEPNPEDPGAGADEARASTSDARTVLTNGRADTIVRDVRRDVCSHCYERIAYAVKVRIEGWRETPIEAAWINEDSRLTHCAGGGMHEPAKVPPLTDAGEVEQWLET